MGKPFIELTDVDKSFGDHRVYRGLTLTIEKGESMCIVGASGSGKSVLLRMLIGLEQPDRGRCCFDGRDLGQLDERDVADVRRRISMLFQSGALFDSLSVAENVAYPLRLRRELAEDAIDRRVEEELTRVGLAETAEQMPAELSGGMKKRVALARAIVSEPEVLLLDEPTAGLDPPTTAKIDELMRSIQRDLGITLVLVTHDLPSAYIAADRIAMLADGKIVAILEPSAFAASELPAIHAFAHALRTEPSP
jgi:phospholipid/cholesterol/gamma-HCH transport system ATP-binding protein